MGKPMSTVYVPDEYGRLVPTQVPTWVGFVGWYAGLEPPEGYLYCDGSAIGRETYSELFEAVGTLYGAGDGAETFNLPDARGVFFRGDGGENNAEMGERQGDAIRNIAGHAAFRAYKGYDSSRNQTLFNGEGAIRHIIGEASLGGSEGPQGVPYRTGSNWGNESLDFNTSRVVPTAAENRPINMALKPCIRYV